MGRFRCRGAWLAIAALAWLVAACGEPPHEFQGSFIDPPLPLPDIRGTNWDGAPFSLKDVDGTLVIVFFGYTHCPDVCPMTLARLKALTTRLADRAGEVSVVLISVDPDRDTLSQLGEYVRGFDEAFYGVHVSREVLAVVASKWGIMVNRGTPEEDADGWYGVDHTGSLYVLGPERALQLRFPQELGVDAMLPDIEALLDKTGSSAG